MVPNWMCQMYMICISEIKRAKEVLAKYAGTADGKIQCFEMGTATRIVHVLEALKLGVMFQKCDEIS